MPRKDRLVPRTDDVTLYINGEKELGVNSCFMCGIDLEDTESTIEHVVPKWLQRRFNLWNLNLCLLNRTDIPYRQLTIPCCQECNTDYLSPVEDTISKAVEEGPEKVRELGKEIIFAWLAKIYYGIIYRELLLPLDRSAPEKGSIVTPELLQLYRTLHLFMQWIRWPIKFEGFFPASMFIYELQEPEDLINAWDIKDTPLLTIAIRMGKVGIIAALLDGGAQDMVAGEYFSQFNQISLHPIQFAEITAEVFYNNTLFNRVPKYLTFDSGDGLTVTQSPLGGWSGKPLFDEPDLAKLAEYISLYTNQPLDFVYKPPDKILSSLKKEGGGLPFIDLHENPWPVDNTDPAYPSV